MFFKQKCICTAAFFYIQILLQKGFLHKYFYGERLLHTGAFRLGRIEEEVIWHGWSWKHDLGEGSSHLGIRFPSILFTERCVYIQGLLHREGPSHRDGFTQGDDFTKGCFYLQVLLHRDTFNTEMLLHKGAIRYKYFYTEMMLLRETFRHRRVFTQVPLHRCFHTGVFTC